MTSTRSGGPSCAVVDVSGIGGSSGSLPLGGGNHQLDFGARAGVRFDLNGAAGTRRALEHDAQADVVIAVVAHSGVEAAAVVAHGDAVFGTAFESDVDVPAGRMLACVGQRLLHDVQCLQLPVG